MTYRMTPDKVTLLAGPRIVADSSHPIWRSGNTPELAVTEFAARVCYRSDNNMGRNPRFVWSRMQEGHLSVFEHARFIFRIDGSVKGGEIDKIRSLPGAVVQKSGDGAWIVSLNGSHLLNGYKQNRVINALLKETAFWEGVKK